MKVPPNNGKRFQIRLGASKLSGYWDGQTLTWYDHGIWHWRFRVASKDTARDQLRAEFAKRGQRDNEGTIRGNPGNRIGEREDT